jgi:DNA-binding HxlR family transcriptional regulator
MMLLGGFPAAPLGRTIGVEKNYKYKGAPRFKVPQPWYNRTTREPWDEDRVSWLLENRNRRLILEALAEGALTFDQLKERLRITLKPHLARREGLSQEMPAQTLSNHLSNLVFYGLVRREGNRYLLNLPVFTLENGEKLRILSKELGSQLAKRLLEVKDKRLLDPLLERAILNAIEELDLEYDWESYHRWMEEYDADEYRSWAKAKQKGAMRESLHSKIERKA